MEEKTTHEKAANKKARRSPSQIDQMISTVVGELSAAGEKINAGKVARQTGLAYATVARRWPGATSSEAQSPAKGIVPEAPLALFDGDDEAGLVLVAQAKYGRTLEAGAYEVAPDMYKCDILIKTDGNLVPHSEAWRRRLPEVREVVKLFRELRS